MALSRSLRDSMRGEGGVRRDSFGNGLYENHEREERRERHAAGDMVGSPMQKATQKAAQMKNQMMNSVQKHAMGAMVQGKPQMPNSPMARTLSKGIQMGQNAKRAVQQQEQE